MLNLMFLGMLKNITTREQTVNSPHADMQSLEFRLILTQNHYTNPYIFHICFPIKIKNRTNPVNDTDDGMITVNNFFLIG